MLRIEVYDHNNNYRKLRNDKDIFHNALKAVLKGEKRFHVEIDSPQKFDLVYEDNDEFTKKDPRFMDSPFFKNNLNFPPYYFYDENDSEKISLDQLDGFDEIFFEEVNEYTVVIASLALEHTNAKVTFKDSDICLFPWIKDKVALGDEPQGENVLYVQKHYFPNFLSVKRISAIALFHCLFILQWYTDKPLDEVKYISYSVQKIEGIGGILATYSRLNKAFNRYGIKVFIEPGSTRYTDELLGKYLCIGDVPEDSNEDNTVYVSEFICSTLNHFVQRYRADISLDLLQPSFIEQMSEYADVVLNDKKVLGVLMRGTDYVIQNMLGSRVPVPTDECIQMIEERVNKYSYDYIFLATEDEDILTHMKNKFPGKILTVSQHRYKVSDFNNTDLIRDLELESYSGNEYYEAVDDMTANYFYAMYLLSRCESLFANCMCGGVDIANSFNQGRFARTEIASLMKQK